MSYFYSLNFLKYESNKIFISLVLNCTYKIRGCFGIESMKCFSLIRFICTVL
jgi:hypothetical protein